MEGVAGMINIVGASVAGPIVDGKLGRVGTMRLAFLTLLVTSAVTLLAVLYFPTVATTHVVFIALCTASALSGFSRAVFMVAMEALFGDSTPSGPARTKYYIYKQQATTLGLAAGPLIAVICFALTKNSWTLPELTVVATVGAAIGVLLAFICLLFTDARTQFADARTPASLPASSSLPATTSAITSAATSATVSLLANAAPIDLRPTADDCDDAERHSPRQPPPPTPLPPPLLPPPPGPQKVWYVPLLISASSICLGLGSGISYKFIPLFCLSDVQAGGLHLSPIAVNGIVAGMQLAAIAMHMCTHACVRTCMHAHACARVHACTRVYASSQACSWRRRMHACVCVRMHGCMHTSQACNWWRPRSALLQRGSQHVWVP